MYFADLTKYTYSQSTISQSEKASLINIGWLDRDHEYNKGDVSPKFLDRLCDFCSLPATSTMGVHTCEICNNTNPIVCNKIRDRGVHVGSSEIWVIANMSNVVYIAPDLIYHYVLDHHYLPPGEFIRAVLIGSLPNSREYQNRLLQLELQPDIIREPENTFSKLKKLIRR